MSATSPRLRVAMPGTPIATPHAGGGAPELAETAPDATTSPRRPSSKSGSNRLLISAGRYSPCLESARREVPPEPVEDRLEPHHTVDGRARARELVALGREAEHLDVLARHAQEVEEELSLLDVAAEVVLGV